MLNKQIRYLKVVRSRLADAEQQRDLAWQAMLETKEGKIWQQLDEVYKQAKGEESSLAAKIRDRAAAIYARQMRLCGHADKKRWPGLTVAEYKVVSIVGDALAWARENAPVLIVEMLDTKPFEKLAKDGRVPEDVAVIEIEPRARIAKEL